MRPRPWPPTPPWRCGWRTTATARRAGSPTPTTRHRHSRSTSRSRRRISRLGVSQPAQPAITPTEAVIRAGGETRVVELGDFGAFEPMKVRHLEITFTNPTRGLAPIGIGEIFLGPHSDHRAVRRRHRDGGRLRVRPGGPGRRPALPDPGRGLHGQRGLGRTARMTLCDADDPNSEPGLDLVAGEHHLEIVSTEQFQPVITTLQGFGIHRCWLHARALDVRHRGRTERAAGPGREWWRVAPAHDPQLQPRLGRDDGRRGAARRSASTAGPRAGGCPRARGAPSTSGTPPSAPT